MTLAELLNKYNASPVTDYDGNTTIDWVPGDEYLDAEGTVVSEELNDLIDEVAGFLAHHPSGHGYGAFARLNDERAYFDEYGDNVWKVA